MANISIYLTEEQQRKLDTLVEKGLVEYLPTEAKRNRSTLIGLLIEQEINRLEIAEMVADAVAIDNLNLGWSEEEEQCQITDMEQFG